MPQDNGWMYENDDEIPTDGLTERWFAAKRRQIGDSTEMDIIQYVMANSVDGGAQ